MEISPKAGVTITLEETWLKTPQGGKRDWTELAKASTGARVAVTVDCLGKLCRTCSIVIALSEQVIPVRLQGAQTGNETFDCKHASDELASREDLTLHCNSFPQDSPREMGILTNFRDQIKRNFLFDESSRDCSTIKLTVQRFVPFELPLTI